VQTLVDAGNAAGATDAPGAARTGHTSASFPGCVSAHAGSADVATLGTKASGTRRCSRVRREAPHARAATRDATNWDRRGHRCSSNWDGAGHRDRPTWDRRGHRCSSHWERRGQYCTPTSLLIHTHLILELLLQNLLAAL
jgi:hypothetical protein